MWRRQRTVPPLWRWSGGSCVRAPTAWTTRWARHPLLGSSGEHPQVVDCESDSIGVRPFGLIGEGQRGTTLMGADDDQRQPSRVRVGGDDAAIFHLLNYLLQQLNPLPVTRRQCLARCAVGFTELSGQGVVGRRARIADAPQVTHVQIDPSLED